MKTLEHRGMTCQNTDLLDRHVKHTCFVYSNDHCNINRVSVTCNVAHLSPNALGLGYYSEYVVTRTTSHSIAYAHTVLLTMKELALFK